MCQRRSPHDYTRQQLQCKLHLPQKHFLVFKKKHIFLNCVSLMEKTVSKVSFANRSEIKTTSTLIYYAPNRRLSHSIPSIIISFTIAQKTYIIFHLSLTLLYFHVASCFRLAWIAQDVPNHYTAQERIVCMHAWCTCSRETLSGNTLNSCKAPNCIVNVDICILVACSKLNGI